MFVFPILMGVVLVGILVAAIIMFRRFDDRYK